MKAINELFFGDKQVTTFDIIVYTVFVTILASMIYTKFFI